MARPIKAVSLKKFLNDADAFPGLVLMAGDDPIVQIHILPKEGNRRTYTIFWRGIADLEKLEAWTVELAEHLFGYSCKGAACEVADESKFRKDVGVLSTYFYEKVDDPQKATDEQNLVWFPWPAKQKLSPYDRAMYEIHGRFLKEMKHLIRGLVTHRIKATFWQNDMAILQADLPGSGQDCGALHGEFVSFVLHLPVFLKELLLKAFLQISSVVIDETEAKEIVRLAEQYINKFYARSRKTK